MCVDKKDYLRHLRSIRNTGELRYRNFEFIPCVRDSVYNNTAYLVAVAQLQNYAVREPWRAVYASNGKGDITILRDVELVGLGSFEA